MLPSKNTLRGTVAALGLLLGLLALPTTTAQAATPDKVYAADAFKATNKARTDHHRVTLKQSSCLQKYATKQAKKMARAEQIFHQQLDPIESDCHLMRAGENVAYGYPNGTSLVVDGWMNSPPHRANILNRKYRLMAIGAKLGDDNRWYVSQVFGAKR
jgi:uncharacterized protein YkwD